MYPTTPPIKFSGPDAGLLVGPSSPPGGSVVVEPGTNNLQQATLDNIAGTTFWLAPGTHTNNLGVFGQVQPKAGNTYVGAPGAVIDGQHSNRTAFAGSGSGVTLRYLEVRNFVALRDQGVINGDSAQGYVVEYCKIHRNEGGAVFLNNGTLRYCWITQNGQYAFQLTSPPNPGGPGGQGGNSLVEYCELSFNNMRDWEHRVYGCGCSGGSKGWDHRGTTVRNCWIHNNLNAGLWWDNNNTLILVEGNYLNDNHSHALLIETSYNFMVRDNAFIRNAHRQGRRFSEYFGDNATPIGAIYVSESGGESAVSSTYALSEIVDNLFLDNWGDVSLWENADRWGSDSSANTSAGYTTLLVDPTGTAPSPVMSNCTVPTINSAPYYSDCRWKTKNVHVKRNRFELRRSRVGINHALTPATGMVALHSNYGTIAPYTGNVIKDAITGSQNNVFDENEYVGDRQWVAYDQGNKIPFATWQATWSQDAASSYTP